MGDATLVTRREKDAEREAGTLRKLLTMNRHERRRRGVKATRRQLEAALARVEAVR